MSAPINASEFDYKLLRGSHEFPGPAGGACLNEVAIVAAGLDYREIRDPCDCPPCFSRPIAAFVIHLNDSAEDKRRQALKRFVLRLAASADTAEVELERAAVLVRKAKLARPASRDIRLADIDLLRRDATFAAERAGLIFMSGSTLAWSEAIDALDAALAIGNQAPPIPDVDALVRLGKVFAPHEQAVPA